MNLILDKIKQYPPAAISLIVFVFLGVILIMRGGVVDALTVREAELIKRIQTINTNIKNSTNLEQDMQVLQRDFDAIREHVFNRNERAANTDFFYSFEDRLDVLITEVTQLTTKDPALVKGGPNELKQYSAIIYDIKVTGTFRKILEFLHTIYQADAFIRVAGFQIDVSRGQELDVKNLTGRLRVIVLAEKL